MSNNPTVQINERDRILTISVPYPSPLPRVGSAVLVEKDDRVLLGVRAKDPGRGDLVIPGGGVEPFETINAAGVREIRDETSLDVEITGRIGVYELLNSNTNTHKIIVYSRARILAGIPHAQTDISELRFYTREELAGLTLSPLIREVLIDAGWVENKSGRTNQECRDE